MKFPAFIIAFTILVMLSCSCTREKDIPPRPVSDLEGNTYKTIRAGTQIWMAENLKSTRLNDATDISLTVSSDIWRNLTAPGYCWYNNNELTNSAVYGALYNGYAINSGKLCPLGWHVPDSEEWRQLRKFLADTASDGGKLKESGTERWMVPNKGATNIIGFTALPSGFRYSDGSFTAIQYYTGFWSGTEDGQGSEEFLGLHYADAASSLSSVSKKYGLSVRCVKD